jgi:hypothetical protein
MAFREARDELKRNPEPDYSTGSGSSCYSGVVNPHGVSGLAGMFPKQATDKLGELFGAMFQTAAAARRNDKRSAPQTDISAARREPESAVWILNCHRMAT